jgi:hypothetical protein
MARQFLLVPLFGALIPLIAGCANSEPEYVPVRGQVLYRDKPLTSGVVMFQPSHGPPARGTIQSDGAFDLTTPGRADGARIGLNHVRISSREAPAEKGGEIAMGRLLIPDRYADFASSGLTAEVKPAGNEPFVFHLTD